jgi:hypothetical protein
MFIHVGINKISVFGINVLLISKFAELSSSSTTVSHQLVTAHFRSNYKASVHRME